MLDDFGGNLTIARWGRIAKCSQAARQDIGELIDRGILVYPRGPSPATIPRSSHRSASSASETSSASEYGLKRTRNSGIHPQRTN